MTGTQRYVVVTGLETNTIWHAPRFWWHAVRSMKQAKQAPGNLSAAAKTINGVHHTLTSWDSEEAMSAFVFSGAHKEAVKVFPKIAMGKTYCYWADALPDWREVPQIWAEKGVA